MLFFHHTHYNIISSYCLFLFSFPNPILILSLFHFPPPTHTLSCLFLCFSVYPPPSVWLVQSLQSGDQEVLVKALKRPPESSLKREGLHAVSLLLRDPRGKVSASASSLLRSLADQPRHRERVRPRCIHFRSYSL